ncbi:hypothetical protein MTO96_041418 [Rhipicephalus appendiculatus]
MQIPFPTVTWIQEDVAKVEEDVDGVGAQRSRGEPDLKGESEGVDGDVEAEQVSNGDNDLGAEREEGQAVATKDKATTEHRRQP